ncbi:MAG: hypothetical protein JWM78_362 [Verrucomicrobiaceae bacterium]|nr:hypothetical protein [Verrucomicrobiaceae bacterium]
MKNTKSIFLMQSISSGAFKDNIFPNVSRQVLVKDQVVFAPPPNPYSSILAAGQRLAAGQSVFAWPQENHNKEGSTTDAGLLPTY